MYFSKKTFEDLGSIFLLISNFDDLVNLYGIQIEDAMERNITKIFKKFNSNFFDIFKLSNSIYYLSTKKDDKLHSKLILNIYYEFFKNPIIFENEEIYLNPYISHIKNFPKISKNGLQNPIFISKKYMKKDVKKVSFLISNLKNNRFNFYFQPIYKIKNGGKNIFYDEALLRCNINSKYNLFNCILAMEDLGMCYFLDYIVIRNILDILKKNISIKIGCNISASSIYYNIFLIDIINRLEKNKKISQRLVLEITETSYLHRDSQTKELLIKIKETGVLIAIDDFGRGFSNIELLKWFRFDIVKIDRDYFNLFFESNNFTAFQNIIEKLIKLSDYIILEGVENKYHYDFLIASNIIFLQGFYLKKPDEKLSFSEKESFKLKFYD